MSNRRGVIALFVSACALLAPFALGCEDTGVIGDQPACASECAEDQHCDLTLELCVQCLDDEGCSEEDRPYCEGYECAQCRTDENCGADRVCAQGACVECDSDDDCMEPGEDDEHVCVDGVCTDIEEDESEDEEDAEDP